MNIRHTVCAVFLSLSSVHTFGQYLTGFESPPFNTGTINGQDSWTVSANDVTVQIRTATEIATDLTNAGFDPGATVHGGQQALILSGAGGNNATIRIIPGLDTEPKVTLDVWARPLPLFNGATAQGNIFLTMEDPAGDRAAAFRFGTQFGTTIDYGTSLSNPWLSSNVPWDSNTWYHLTMAVDYLTKTYDFTINGTKVNVDPIPFYTANADNFSQIRIFRGANHAGMIVDDLVVIPEPGTFASLLIGGSALCLRRRRR